MALIGLARMAAITGDYQRATMLLAAKEEMTTINLIVGYWPMDRIENERMLAIFMDIGMRRPSPLLRPKAQLCH